MKKYINLSFIYAMAAILCGVFYREYTKYSGFTGKTVLSVTHVHFFVLGTFLFLLIALFAALTDLEQQKQFRAFMILYNIGLPFMVIMFFVRGILQVEEVVLSKGMNASVSGMAGISHTIITIAFVLLFLCLRKTVCKFELKKTSGGKQ